MSREDVRRVDPVEQQVVEQASRILVSERDLVEHRQLNLAAEASQGDPNEDVGYRGVLADGENLLWARERRLTTTGALAGRAGTDARNCGRLESYTACMSNLGARSSK